MPAELVFAPLHRTVIVAVGNRAGNDPELGRTYTRSIGLAALLLLPLYAGLAFFAIPLVHAILTPPFWTAAEVLPIMCITEASRALGAFAGVTLVAAGRAKIPMLAWIIPYPITGLCLALNWDHLTLVTTAWSFAAGMLAVNIFVIAAAFIVLKSWKLEKAKLGKALACTTITALAAYGYSRVDLANWPLLISAVLLLPLFHLGVVGMVFAGNPFAYMSPDGLRRLRGTL